ncbi:DUF6152 family protein [Polymorphum gilvum]|uniref:Uncharacterized protein n=1 Tax=Polymorphum gilvum (strain LMG 25793 / CGMCC 1.9160 / SL003B-26A1) TaxID=991905 RepID=F2J411_POLGS|nr:DUF6152 family protein [Polymorphum gilvum]ADZ69936.1 hypothetical protein SL003B_1509 [Polymorphum gilvum SL003B-26A1]
MRRETLVFGLLVALAGLRADPAAAHHGWSWTTGRNLQLVGVIVEVRLGNPHGMLKVDAEGDVWTVEVGQPWRNQRAGLRDGDLAVGTEITIIGEPSANLDDRLLKAEKIRIGGRDYDLYPGRD